MSLALDVIAWAIVVLVIAGVAWWLFEDAVRDLWERTRNEPVVVVMTVMLLTLFAVAVFAVIWAFDRVVSL